MFEGANGKVCECRSRKACSTRSSEDFKPDPVEARGRYPPPDIPPAVWESLLSRQFFLAIVFGRQIP